jgi:integrase
MASVYKTPSGWRVQVRIKGKPTLSKIFPRHNLAVAWGREQEELLHRHSTPDRHLTYAQIHARYAEFSRPPGRTKDSVLRRLLEYWGEWRMIEIGTRAITDWAKMRKRDGAGPATIHQELCYLGTVIGNGAVLCESEEANRTKAAVNAAMKTLRAVGLVGESERRERRPTDDELRRLEQWFFDRPRSSSPMMDIVRFAICTTMRLGEIVGAGGIVWEDYDDVHRTIWIRARKDPTTNEGRDDNVPLLRGPVTIAGEMQDPVAIMLRQKSARRRQGRVFPYAESGVSNTFARAVKELGIDDLRFHDLRHDAISRLFEAGYDIPEVALVSGHRTWKNLQRYTHITPKALHRNIAR